MRLRCTVIFSPLYLESKKIKISLSQPCSDSKGPLLRDGVLLEQMSSLKPPAEGIFLAHNSHTRRDWAPTHSYLNPSAHITSGTSNSQL